MKFLINNAASADGSSEMAVFENNPMSTENIHLLCKLGTRAIIGAVAIAAINAAGVCGVIMVATVAVLVFCVTGIMK